MDELQRLLESLQEGEETDVMDLSDDILSVSKFSLSEEQSKNPVVLCTVEGPGMGPFDEENRNVRDYSKEVATVGILSIPYVKEMLRCKTLLGEPHHPKDRNEIWCDESSHSIIDMWLSEDERYLMVRMDILDTPNGRILKTLIDYGCLLGISARASGKTRKEKGRLKVVPEAYKFKTFDVVTNPGFLEARVKPINEEVNESNSVFEGLEKLVESTDMETLKSVRGFIEYFDDERVRSLIPLLESRLEGSDNSGVDESDVNTLEELVEGLSEELEKSRQMTIDLKSENSELKTKYGYVSSMIKKAKSVGEHEEVFTEEINNLKRALALKNESIKQLQSDNKELLEQLNESQDEIASLRGEVEDLRESRRVAVSSLAGYRRLNESLQRRADESEEVFVTEEEDDSEPAPVVRRRKVGIGSIVNQTREASLNEENTSGRCNERRVSLIRRIGGQ